MGLIDWYYFAQEDEGEVTHWRGSNELRRLSNVVLRQRRFHLGPISVFFGDTEVEVEVVWEMRGPSVLPPDVG